MGLLEQIAESSRREEFNDSKFVEKLTYFFELVVPESVGGPITSYLFPLALNPNEITTSEPFTITATPTQGGGLFVEENGIVQRMIRIRGNTGFKPRRSAMSGFGNLQSPERRSYGREVTNSSQPFPNISGQRHFQFLQDVVFRTYADLKRDPSTSAETQLIWHNPKDDEHWRVVPQKFDGQRNADKPTLYSYSIDLLAVDAADETSLISEDLGMLEAINDAIQTVKDAINLGRGAINAITEIVSDISQFIGDIRGIVDSVTELLDAADNFVTGISSLIDKPFAQIEALGSSIGGAMDSLQDLSDTLGLTDPADTISDVAYEAILDMADSVNMFGFHPTLFQQSPDVNVAELTAQQELSTSRSATALAAGTAPTSISEAQSLGSGPVAGEADKAKGERGIGRVTPRYTGAIARKVGQGDTLQSIAARYMGDARLWRHIAALNKLSAPYISSQSLPNAVTTGDQLLIPDFSKSPSRRVSHWILGVDPAAEAEEVYLGRDWKLERTAANPGLFDIPIDTNGGSVDGQDVSGYANLQQAVRTRLMTLRGSVILYKKLGLQRIVGTGAKVADREIARFRVSSAVKADPRVAAIKRVKFNTGDDPYSNLDVLDTEFDVEVRGFNESARIQAQLAK